MDRGGPGVLRGHPCRRQHRVDSALALAVDRESTAVGPSTTSARKRSRMATVVERFGYSDDLGHPPHLRRNHRHPGHAGHRRRPGQEAARNGPAALPRVIRRGRPRRAGPDGGRPGTCLAGSRPHRHGRRLPGRIPLSRRRHPARHSERASCPRDRVRGDRLRVGTGSGRQVPGLPRHRVRRPPRPRRPWSASPEPTSSTGPTAACAPPRPTRAPSCASTRCGGSPWCRRRRAASAWPPHTRATSNTPIASVGCAKPALESRSCPNSGHQSGSTSAPVDRFSIAAEIIAIRPAAQGSCSPKPEHPSTATQDPHALASRSHSAGSGPSCCVRGGHGTPSGTARPPPSP